MPTGFIEGTVTDRLTGAPIKNARVFAGRGPNAVQQTVNPLGQYRLSVESGEDYLVTAVAEGYSSETEGPTGVIPAGATVAINIELQITPEEIEKRRKATREQPFKAREERAQEAAREKAVRKTEVEAGVRKVDYGGFDWVKFIIALLITAGVYLFFYRPIILEGLQVTDPYTPPILNFFVPLGMFFGIYFALPEMRKYDPAGFGKFITALIIAGVFTGMIIILGVNFPLTKGPQSTSIQFGIPFATFIIVTIVARKSLDDPKTKTAELILRLTGILALIGGGYFLLSLFLTGAYLNIETYLKPLDVLKVIGIPQSSIDSLKDGVRNTLGFLQFQGVNQQPQAEKVGGFDALQVKYGSKYANYVPPKVSARTNYTLPVNVLNPNPIDSSLKVENFYIDEAFLVNNSDKTMCGEVRDCSKYTTDGGRTSNGCTISPGEERSLTIEFNNKTNCSSVVLTYDDFYLNNPSITPNPLSSLTIKIDPKQLSGPVDIAAECENHCSSGTGVAVDSTCYTKCVKEACLGMKTYPTSPFTYNICGETLKQSNQRYGVQNELDTNHVTYDKDANVCLCRVNKYYNLNDELCFQNNNKAEIDFKSHFDFKVQGKGSLTVIKTESDKTNAPKPKITSSAGPLTITTYFVPDNLVLDKQSQTVRMFVQVDNTGTDSGVAQIKNISYSTDKTQLQVKSCAPDPSKASLFVDKSGITLSCELNPQTDSLKSSTGNFLTVPVIVDMNYTYSKSNSVTLDIQKVTIPDQVSGTQRQQLIASQSGLPYYCPADMNIYGPFQ